MTKFLTMAIRLPSVLLVLFIRAYQVAISPMLGARCRFYPSCSHYGLGAIRAHGALKGSALTAWRILRCNPWNLGGIDPVPPTGSWRPTVDLDGNPVRTPELRESEGA